jgi:oxidoreductase
VGLIVKLQHGKPNDVWFTAVKSALIFGATGQTGRHLLRELIASSTFTRVCEAGRNVTPAEELPAQASGKLEQKVIDFERLEEAGLKEGQWDVVFIACVWLVSVFSPSLHDSSTRVFLYRMGTTAKNAGSQENFTKIDKEYVEPFFDHLDKFSSSPLYIYISSFSVTAHVFFSYVVNAAKVAKTDKDQRLIYVSVCSSFEPVGFSSHIIIYFMQVTGANPTSSILYPRSKGLTEQALAELGYKDTISFRPTALSNTNRPQPRFAETAFLYAPLALSFCPFCPSCFSYCCLSSMHGKLVADCSFSFSGLIV